MAFTSHERPPARVTSVAGVPAAVRQAQAGRHHLHRHGACLAGQRRAGRQDPAEPVPGRVGHAGALGGYGTGVVVSDLAGLPGQS